ncbi:hypothetical protein QJS10_CPB12g00769 [Acorus calamus]|uniref:DCD domain-containing protein n=1 Tax=Acorus calamus TaxID=4465 RepID=A0AAV9DNW4_ACOCL|nr:hypothetical protein QJS10_CPB12g00769 [Acorus calamus]
METPLIGAGGDVGASSGVVPKVGGSVIGYTRKRRRGDRPVVVEEAVLEVGGPAEDVTEGFNEGWKVGKNKEVFKASSKNNNNNNICDVGGKGKDGDNNKGSVDKKFKSLPASESLPRNEAIGGFGGTNIDPLAWEDKKFPGESRFSAQVRVINKKICGPLEEDSFRPILHHYDGPKFRLELSIPEALALLDIFTENNA